MAALLAVAALAAANSTKVASGGDPHRVSVDRLKASLRHTGVPMRYVKPLHEPVPAVAGVAEEAPARGMGFEYQVFPSSDEATVEGLGKLRPAELGWPKPRQGVIFEPVVRGVLGNVAYAIYERHFLDEKGTHEEAMDVQLATQHVLRALDDALFEAFSPGDPYANALSTTP